MPKRSAKKGFTLVELIIYIAIASMVLVGAVNVAWNLITANATSDLKRDVYMNARVVTEEFGRQVRGAEDVDTGSSTFGANPGVLTLDYPGGNTDKVFDTYNKDVVVGGQIVNITKLRITEGTSDPVDLTNDHVDVGDFTLTDLTQASEPDNVLLELTLDSVNPGGDMKYDVSISVQTSISIRQ
jgi:prepilin-type N-terminal cleavage/methylation domain-containing protein